MQKKLLLLLPVLALFPCLTACGSTEESSASEDIFAMDTVMNLTVYGEDADSAVSACIQRINELDALFSTNNEKSDIYAINHADGAATKVSQDTIELISDALSICASTDGLLDISIYPVLTAWGFTTESYQIPDTDTIQSLLELVDYQKIQVDTEAQAVTLSPGMEIDLGAVAKGYTGDALVYLLQERGISSAILNLGGNVQTLGAKPDGSDWNVGITDPEDPENYFAAVSVKDKAVVTSGGYERYFIGEDGKTYIHIIDPRTGAPAESGLESVTIVCDTGVTADGLSTALFIMGLDEAEEYWRSNGGFEAVFVTDDGGIYITEGLQDTFRLMDDYADRTVTVIYDEN